MPGFKCHASFLAHWPVTRCPSCGAVAEASQAPFVLDSTGGPVLHQAWSCAAGCRWHTYVLSPEAAVLPPPVIYDLRAPGRPRPHRLASP